MSAFDYHRGIGFSIVELADRRWQWSIHPPPAVLGFKTKGGLILGTRNDAIEAAKREIEKQDAGTS